MSVKFRVIEPPESRYGALIDIASRETRSIALRMCWTRAFRPKVMHSHYGYAGNSSSAKLMTSLHSSRPPTGAAAQSRLLFLTATTMSSYGHLSDPDPEFAAHLEQHPHSPLSPPDDIATAQREWIEQRQPGYTAIEKGRLRAGQ